MHSDLIAKLEALDGPSRDVDALIATTIGGFVYEKRGRDQKAWFYPADGGWRRQLNGIFADKLPAYTASLDAAIAIAGRVLPGWEYQRKVTSTGIFIQMVGPEYVRFEFMGSRNPHMGASSPVSARNFYRGDAIALLIATLKALEARDG